MSSFVEVMLQDGDGRHGRMIIPVADVALPTGYQAKLDALTALFGGATTEFLTSANVRYTRVIIESSVYDTVPTIASDIRNTWRVRASAAGYAPFYWQLPGRLTIPEMTTEESKGVLIDQSIPAFDALVAALAASTGLGMKDKAGHAAFLNAMKARTTRRVDPRI
jgi:hypothetical protein